jgi:hypothetical protein
VNAVIVSYGQDTNGQNARYVQAARKHGAEAMKAIAIGATDPAGVVSRFAEAGIKMGTLELRSAARVVPYFEFPADIIWDAHTEPLIKQLVAEADVVHLNNSYRAISQFHVRKPMLLHHHGSLFRSDPPMMLALARRYRMAQAVSTIDLTRPAPDVLHWLPSAYDIDGLQAMRKANRRDDDGRVRIVHSPTNRAYKHTDLFLTVVRELAETLPIDLVMVEGRTNAETLVEKAKADIVYDQLMFGYGCNSIEAWGMGIPVISGGDAWTLNRMDEMWGALPFAEAEESTLKDVIRGLVMSADMRQEYAERGLAHVRKYHDERPALDRLLELYELAIKTYHRQRTVAPVRFRNNGKSVTWDKMVIPSGTEIEISDPDAITHLRALAKRSAFDVEEVA